MKKLVYTALIAAIYAALTIFLAPISYGVIQIRLSEALTVLPFFSFYPVIGLFIGCIISNLFSPAGVLDIIFGSLATLISAFITYFIGKSRLKFKKFIAPLPAVIINGIMIGILLNLSIVKDPVTAAFTGFKLNKALILSSMFTIGFEEIIPCYVLGLPLIYLINKNKTLKKYFSI